MQVKDRRSQSASSGGGALRTLCRACGLTYVLGHPVRLVLFLAALALTTLAAHQVAQVRRATLASARASSAIFLASGGDARGGLVRFRDRNRALGSSPGDSPPPPDAKQVRLFASHTDQLLVFLERVRLWLHPFTAKYTAKVPAPPLAPRDKACGRKWSSRKPQTYLAGCPNNPESLDPCDDYDDLDLAKKACEELGEACGGITLEANMYQVRNGRIPQPQGEEPNDSWLFLPDPCDDAYAKSKRHSSAEAVWDAFRTAVDASLEDPALSLREPLGPAREDDSIFISISSYRDDTCAATLKRAFERAARPERISAGIVQQNCQSQTKCFTGTGWGNTRRWVPRPGPDEDCAEAFCASALGRPHCEAGRVRILRLDEIDSLGPFFSRFVNSRLWRAENFYLQIDAHTDFRSSWDLSMVEQMRNTPTYPKSVISNYPPGGTPKHDTEWAAPNPLASPGESHAPPSALCSCTFETAGAGRYTVRLGENGREISTNRHIPRRTCFVAAGFFIAHGSLVDAVGFDPFLPYLFMGEELALSLRFWTHGYDLYAPSVDVLQHEYVRKHAPKFWESVGEVYSNPGIHNELTDLIVQRVQHLAKFPEADAPEKVQPASLLTRMSEFGPGPVRSEKDFAKNMGLDFVHRVQRAPAWCTAPP